MAEVLVANENNARWESTAEHNLSPRIKKKSGKVQVCKTRHAVGVVGLDYKRKPVKVTS